MDLFEEKNIKPMLIGAEGDPFDDPLYLYELKLDGERCIAYLDPKHGTELRNKRNDRMLPKLPELSNIHELVNERCILDGELIVIKNGAPDFSEIQRRSMMSNSFKIKLASEQYAASFVAYDIVFLKDDAIHELPLTDRKKALQGVVQEETKQLAVSRVLDGAGTKLYQLAKEKKLEGIVAKKKESRYYFNKRTSDWIKIKNLLDDDFIVCGYIHKERYVVSLVLGQLRDGNMVYKGHVTMGVSREDYKLISAQPHYSTHPFLHLPSGSNNELAIWIEPALVCTVKYMQHTSSGGLRQPVFKGLRFDKPPSDCIDRFHEEKK